MEQTNTYLKTVPFNELLFWDVKMNLLETLSFNYPTVRLNKVLSKTQIEWVEISDEKEYPILGVRAQGKGVYINRIAKGKELKMRKYQVSKPFSLFYCKVRTVKGQWGIVYPEFANSFGSSNMNYLDVDFNKISAEYLMMLLKSEKITNQWDKNSVGADGRHFPLKTMLNLKIPLPPLPEQNRIVAEYNQKIQLAQQQEQEANDLEQVIEDYLYNSLKLDKNVVQQKEKGLQFTSLNQTSRWDTLFLIGNMPVLETSYPIKQFRDVVVKFNKGPKNESIRVNSKDYPNDEFVYIGMEHIEKETGNLLDVVKVKGKEIKSQTLRVPQDYLLYGKLRPYLNKYWINETSYDNIICSSEFFVFDIKTGVNKQFFKYVLSSSFIQQQITDKTSGARMPRINETIFYNLQFPLPDFNKQNEIANHIDGLKNQIKDLRKKANANREEAIFNFEQEIFNA